MAKLVAKKLGIPLLAGDWGSLLGADEPDYALQSLIEVAVSMAPIVLLWDDFDKGFAGWDNARDGGIARRLTGRLLTWMQEYSAPIFIVGTINRLGGFLPPELVRRFEKIWFVDLPDRPSMYEIFNLHLAKNFPHQFNDPDYLSSRKGARSIWSDTVWWQILEDYNLCTPDEIGKAVKWAADEIYYDHYKNSHFPETLEVAPSDLRRVRGYFTPALIRDEDAIYEIRNKAIYARPATSRDMHSRFCVPPAELFA